MRKINTFWNWFQDNNQTIKTINNETIEKQEHILFWINKHLGYYCKEIDFIIVFPNTAKDKTEFTITCNGNPEYFNQVIALIDNAPKLKTWKFTAVLLPSQVERRDIPIFSDITLKSNDSKFLSLDYNENAKKANIFIHLKSKKIICNTKTFNQVIALISQDQLSELIVDKNNTLVQLPQEPQENTESIQLYDLETLTEILNKQNNT
ncbi:hypothetical protein [uncultured Flavobacterium sp.]|uniref:hypothetical protein n=1 Tax=uncultured Flavobacterium sp. TaxID=165435 RepID=UPI0030ED2D37|tara:strand:- start:4005 stop:4625 length:621 start_codon:yes stop_codon:yes gene_type:complete